MNVSTVVKLSKALRSIDNLPRLATFYLHGEYPWTTETLCYIVEIQSEEFGTEVENEFINQNSVQDVFDVVDVEQIVDFALRQVPDATDQLLVDSFNFYWRNDAPLIFGEDDDT